MGRDPIGFNEPMRRYQMEREIERLRAALLQEQERRQELRERLAVKARDLRYRADNAEAAFNPDFAEALDVAAAEIEWALSFLDELVSLRERLEAAEGLIGKLDQMVVHGEDYCGCCGNETDADRLWCDRCEGHVSDAFVSIWDRTYFAQHGTDCPFTPYVAPVPQETPE